MAGRRDQTTSAQTKQCNRWVELRLDEDFDMARWYLFPDPNSNSNYAANGFHEKSSFSLKKKLPISLSWYEASELEKSDNRLFGKHRFKSWKFQSP